MHRMLERIDWVSRKFCMGIYAIIVLVSFLQVLTRYLFDYPLIWVDEFSKYLFVWLIFVGVALGARRKAHFATDFALVLLPPAFRRGFLILAQMISIVFLAMCLWYIPKVMVIAHTSISSTVGIPLSWVYAGMLVGFFLAFLAEIANLFIMLKSVPVERTTDQQSS